MQNTKGKIQNAKYKRQNTKCKIQKAKYKRQNIKWQPEHNGKCQPERAHRMSRSYTAGLRRMMGRRPSSDWSSVRVPHLSTIGAIRKERYMIMSCKFFFFFWKWSIHNSFGHIFSILFSLFVDKLNIFSTSEIPFIVGTRLSLDTTVGLHLCVRTYSPTRTSERV